MGMTTLFTAAFLATLGISVISYLGWAMLGPVVESLRGRKDHRKFERVAEKIVEADSLIADGQLLDAIRVLREAPLLDIFERAEMIELVREHHQNILSRCVVIAEELQTRSENIAEVERLILERTELQTLYLRAAESYSSLRNRREKAGKDIPDWSKSDFEQRLSEIQNELEKNHLALASAFQTLFSSIERSRRDGDIVYH